MGASIHNIGIVYYNKGDYDKAINYYEWSLAIKEEVWYNSWWWEPSYMSSGLCFDASWDYGTVLDYYGRSLAIFEELGDKFGIGLHLGNIGIVYYNKGDYKKALDYLEKSLSICKEIGFKSFELETTTCLYLTYKHLGRDYDINEIHILIKDAENIESDLNYEIYQLLEDKSYLETAYNQVQEKADNLEPDVKAKFLSYPIPAAIVEEWEKVK